MDNTKWFLWSVLLAITCWSSLALLRYRLWIATLCLATSFLVPKMSLLLQKKNHIEIVAIPPYQFFSIATHTHCITYISQSDKTTPHHTWQRWLSSLTCEPTIIILAQQDLWRESHAIHLHTNRKLTSIFSPKKTFSTLPCESSEKQNQHLLCTASEKDCQCSWKAKKSTVIIETGGLQVIKTPSAKIQSITATTLPQEIILE